mgnify:FL=1
MVLNILSENTAYSKDFACEHGLSIHLEAEGQKLLFDTGAGPLFLENAKRLDLDIADVDFLFLSHSHYDHGGGIKAFLEVNKKAKAYLSAKAFGDYYALREGGDYEYIGLDKNLKANKRIKESVDGLKFGEIFEVLSAVEGSDFIAKANAGLFKKEGATRVSDDFAHEQSLIVRVGGKSLLITGCAHKGIVAILKSYHAKYSNYPDFVIGGFQLSSRSGGQVKDKLIEEIGLFLKRSGAQFYTGHCTGLEAYGKLKTIMGGKLDYAAAGRVIKI